MCGFFSNIQAPRHDLGYCKLYDAKLATKCTKIQLASGLLQPYEFLKSSHHRNILKVLKITKNSLYVPYILPLSVVYDSDKEEYNRYVIIRITEAVKYLHETLKMEHRGIEMNAIFIESSGCPVLGRFDCSREYSDGSKDVQDLDTLCRAIAKADDVELLGTPHEAFLLLEDASVLKSNDISQKRSYFSGLFSQKKHFIPLSIRHIISLAIKQISEASESSYKKFLLDGLFSFDREVLSTEFPKERFSILNSAVRLYLLTNIGSVTNLDGCIREICLGLYVKDKTMRLETVKYIFLHCNSLSYDSFAKVLSAMQEVNDTETVGIICHKLAGVNRDKTDKMIEKALEEPLCKKMLYKLLLKYLNLGKSRLLLYTCIERHFEFFDKIKLSTEMLPLLCTKLCDSEGQERCFLLVEKILLFLRQNKDEIKKKEWAIPSLRKILGKKETTHLKETVLQSDRGEAMMWDEEDFDD